MAIKVKQWGAFVENRQEILFKTWKTFSCFFFNLRSSVAFAFSV